MSSDQSKLRSRSKSKSPSKSNKTIEYQPRSDASRSIFDAKSSGSAKRVGVIGVFSSEVSSNAPTAHIGEPVSIPMQIVETPESPSKPLAHCPRITEEGIRDFMGDEEYVAATFLFGSKPGFKTQGNLNTRGFSDVYF